MEAPAFVLRRSVRARHVILRVEPRRGLVVVLPPWAGPADARRAVAERRDWIARALARLAAQGRLEPEPPALPDRLGLPALGLEAEVLALSRAGLRPRLEVSAGRILLLAAAGTAPEDLLPLLRRHVFLLARERLPGRLRALSRRSGLPFGTAHVRAQRRRWGSCTARGDIQLNCKLLFLPPELVDHVCLHELCHTRHFNHGPEFHALLRRLSPDAPVLDRRLARAGRLVPSWMEPLRP